MRDARSAILAACLMGALVAAPAAAQDPSPGATDALTTEPWPARTLKGAEAITAGNDRFVVVGGRGGGKPLAKAWTSDDGLIWTKAPASPELEGAVMSEVIAVDDGFVALGTDAKDHIAAWHSPDGLTWERGRVEKSRKKGLQADLRDVVDGPGGLLAFGVFTGQELGGQRLWHSADGLAWERVAAPVDSDVIIESLAEIPGGYLLIGHPWDGGNSYWRSDDGLTWEPVEDAPWLRDVATTSDGTVVGIGLADIWSSADLETWEQVWQSPNPKSGDDEEELHWLAWDGARLVTTGNVAYGYQPCLDGAGFCPLEPLMLSSDGRSWTESTGPDGMAGPDRETWFGGVASLDDRTVAIGSTAAGPTVAWLMEVTE
jgi:hypothetical protein